MQNNPEYERTDSALFTAGQRMPRGRYREVNSGRIIALETEDLLPASLDGRVACYICLSPTWAEIASQSFPAEGGEA